MSDWRQHEPELLERIENDEATRERLQKTGELFEGYAPEMEKVHIANGRWLETKTQILGWPKTEDLSPDGHRAAWTILLHAISLPDFQRKIVTLLDPVTQGGETITRSEWAMLFDRVCFFERRPQRYGTQFDWTAEGVLSPWTLEDPNHVDELRASVGLEPLANTTQRLRDQARAEGESCPKDLEGRERNFQEWARRVGWLK